MDDATTHRPRGLVLVLVAAGVAAALTLRWFVFPPTVDVDEVGEADAVVMFVGGRGERLDTAHALMDRGVAPVLVIPNGRAPEWPEANVLCRGDAPFQVLCPDPQPDTTRGEARAIADLAASHGWSKLVAVTSTYHVHRASLLLDRCHDGTITMVAAPTGLDPIAWVTRLAHEWVGTVGAAGEGC